jgi:hypothetical protein
VPTEDHYTPTVGVSISSHTGTVAAGDEARRLHAGTNRGPMLAIGYWCENGCHGRIDLREHKGYLFASLHNLPQLDPWTSRDHLNGLDGGVSRSVQLGRPRHSRTSS